ncbi:hypothetical protein MKW92_027404 [Papaver armeniacum]|nr:hypothetical protein MKW92_027404 [Papaver armeniacum]
MENSSPVTEKMRELKLNETDKDLALRNRNPHIIEWEEECHRSWQSRSRNILKSYKRKGVKYVATPGVVGSPSKWPLSEPPRDLGPYTDLVENYKNDKVEMATPRGKYKEDIYIGNHTTVWGSWWKDHQWGYKCCQQVTRNSYCTRSAGVEVVESTTDLMEAKADRFEDVEAFLGFEFGEEAEGVSLNSSMETSSCENKKMRELKLMKSKLKQLNFPRRNPHIPWNREEEYDRSLRFSGDHDVNMSILKSLKRRGIVYLPTTELVVKNDKAEMAIPRGKYKEDICTGNHTTVWGSWWKDHQWGYKCCQQFTRSTYCTRTAGVEAVESTTDLIKADAASHQKKRRLARFVDLDAFLARRRGVVAREAGLPPAEVVGWGKEINPCFS